MTLPAARRRVTKTPAAHEDSEQGSISLFLVVVVLALVGGVGVACFFATLMRTVAPCCTFVWGAGFCASTVPAGCVDATSTTRTFRPCCCSAFDASCCD